MKKTFSEIIEEKSKEKDYGICPPSLTPDEALEILTNYLLGEDWYCVSPIHAHQVNTEIVHEILYKYSDKYRKELKENAKKDKKISKLESLKRKLEIKLKNLKEK